MNKGEIYGTTITTITTTIIGSSFVVVVLLLYFGLTTTTITHEEGYNKNSILNPIEIFGQEDKAFPVVKSSKILDFSGINYADVVNSKDINLNSFTVSVWFNTAMNVTGKDVAFLINKGGFGTERAGFNLNYGIWLDNRERVTAGFETLTGEDYFIASQGSYADGIWNNAILTFDNEKLGLLNLYLNGMEIAANSTGKGIIPDNTGKQPIRLGANSFSDKGKINGNYTGQLDDIQVWDYAFTKEQVASLFHTESKIAR